MTAVRFVLVNGTLVRWSDARLAPDDLGFLAGDGVFTTLRVVEGVPLFLGAHIARLLDGLVRVGIESPPAADALRHDVHRLVAAEPAVASSARLRITVTRGTGTPPASAQGPPNVVMAIDPWSDRAETARGVAIEMASTRREPHALHTIKSTSRAPYSWLRGEATTPETFDVVQCNTRGHLAEGSFTNVFVVDRTGVLRTPAVADGCLPGIVRAVVLDVARRAGHDCREGEVEQSILGAARELFLTSSLAGVVPVRTLDGAAVGAACPGPVTAALRDAYVERVREEMALAHGRRQAGRSDVR